MESDDSIMKRVWSPIIGTMTFINEIIKGGEAADLIEMVISRAKDN